MGQYGQAVGRWLGHGAAEARGPFDCGRCRGLLARWQGAGVGIRDETVKLWDAGSGAVLQTLEGHSGREMDGSHKAALAECLLNVSRVSRGQLVMFFGSLRSREKCRKLQRRPHSRLLMTGLHFHIRYWVSNASCKLSYTML
jgi:hypothetical protein